MLRMKGSTFFDASAVIRRVDAAERRILSRFGAFVRTRARSSIRKRKKISEPGKPPSSHTGQLRRLIFFGYDFINSSVIIGPMPFRGPAVAPRLLEEGGRVRSKRALYVPGEPGRDIGGRFTKRRTRRIPPGTTLQYRPRPYMGPAFRTELAGAPALWKDAIR